MMVSERLSVWAWGDLRVPRAAPTAIRDGICSAFVSSLLLCVIIVRMDSTMTTRFTDPML